MYLSVYSSVILCGRRGTCSNWQSKIIVMESVYILSDNSLSHKMTESSTTTILINYRVFVCLKGTDQFVQNLGRFGQRTFSLDVLA